MYFSIDDLLPVFVKMMIVGANTTSIITDKLILKKLVAKLTNSSSSEVYIRIVNASRGCPVNLTCVGIDVKIVPRDRSHEIYIVSKLNRTDSVPDEINLMLQNQTTSNDLYVQRVRPIRRVSFNCKESYF